MNVKRTALCLTLSLLLLLAGCARKAPQPQNDAGSGAGAAQTNAAEAQDAQAADAQAPDTQAADTQADTQTTGAASTDAGVEAPQPAYVIEHLDLSEGYPVEMYYELPVFREDTEALRSINRQLAAVRQAYLDERAADELQMVIEDTGTEYGPTKEEPYCNTHSAIVHTFTDELVSVAFAYDWWMGGVMDYGVETYTFNAKTGERLYLNDLTDGTEAEIKESIVNALVEQYPGVEEAGVMETPMDAVRAMDIRDFHFYVEQGKLCVAFNKYEITYGAAGAFDVTLPDALRLPA